MDRREALQGIAGVLGAIGLGGFIGSGFVSADAGGSRPMPEGKDVHPRLKKVKIPWKDKFNPKINLKDLLDSLDLDQSKREVVESTMTYMLREVGYEMVAVEGMDEKKAFKVIGGVLARFQMNALPAIKKAFEKKKG